MEDPGEDSKSPGEAAKEDGEVSTTSGSAPAPGEDLEAEATSTDEAKAVEAEVTSSGMRAAAQDCEVLEEDGEDDDDDDEEEEEPSNFQVPWRLFVREPQLLKCDFAIFAGLPPENIQCDLDPSQPPRAQLFAVPGRRRQRRREEAPEEPLPQQVFLRLRSLRRPGRGWDVAGALVPAEVLHGDGLAPVCRRQAEGARRQQG